MKRFVKPIIALIAICLLISGVSLSAFAGSPSLNEKKVEVKFRQIIQMPDSSLEDVELLEQAIEAGAVTGWAYNEAEQRFERFVNYDNVKVVINDVEADLDNTGRATILTKTDSILEVEAYDPITDENYTQLISGDSTDSMIIFDLDISPMLSIDADNQRLAKDDNPSVNASATNPYWSNGEKGVYGYRLHCNRFNGFLGDGRYYSNQASKQAVLNFLTSDCDWALKSYSLCLADYTSNPFCAASPASYQASCSTLIGHYNRFHQHTCDIY